MANYGSVWLIDNDHAAHSPVSRSRALQTGGFAASPSAAAAHRPREPRPNRASGAATKWRALTNRITHHPAPGTRSQRRNAWARIVGRALDTTSTSNCQHTHLLSSPWRSPPLLRAQLCGPIAHSLPNRSVEPSPAYMLAHAGERPSITRTLLRTGSRFDTLMAPRRRHGPRTSVRVVYWLRHVSRDSGNWVVCGPVRARGHRAMHSAFGWLVRTKSRNQSDNSWLDNICTHKYVCITQFLVRAYFQTMNQITYYYKS